MKAKKEMDNFIDKEKEAKRRAKGYWKKLMDSTQEKLSQGASNISKIIPHARNDGWRRSDKK